jgi:hypothetical protein
VIRDYILALLSAPLSDADTLDTEPPLPWQDAIGRWLERAAELDPDLRFDRPAPSPDGHRLRVVIRRAVPATIEFVLVTGLEFDQPMDCDLAVLLLRDERCVPPETDGYLVMEPRWAATVLLAGPEPLFWGVSAREEPRSLLDSLLPVG